MRSREFGKGLIVTKAVFDEVVECVAIQVVGELVIGGGEFLEALRGNAREIALEPTPSTVFLFVSLCCGVTRSRAILEIHRERRVVFE